MFRVGWTSFAFESTAAELMAPAVRWKKRPWKFLFYDFHHLLYNINTSKASSSGHNFCIVQWNRKGELMAIKKSIVDGVVQWDFFKLFGTDKFCNTVFFRSIWMNCERDWVISPLESLLPPGRFKVLFKFNKSLPADFIVWRWYRAMTHRRWSSEIPTTPL